ncbi:cyclic AMP-responsive element-binding protein 3-like protein 4 isoform X2 [Heptranchias perlo]|uniref:cyclic AMP-responsive element-binding protein 3-like protein 4 isoform X2 n=1 Tax=Heptranchias perlo TaxID=212740 RepID=UPI00355A99AF
MSLNGAGQIQDLCILVRSGPSASTKTLPSSKSQGMNESESEDALQMMINPNEVYSSNNPAESASETDSGISDDQRPDSPQHSNPGPLDRSPPALYQVVYGVSVMDTVKSEEMPGGSDLVSIELGGWNAQMLIPEACIVDTVPRLTATAGKSSGKRPLTTSDSDTDITDSLMHFPDLSLTEEEKRLLNQEGIVLPSNLPLTKAEERILKKVRRKIRNKQSAQESRRRKKEYIDGLESRVAACTAQNQDLQKQVLQLEHHNVSLITQLRRLQSLIKQTSNKAAQTSTCVMILACSLVLLIFPSYNPFRLETPVNQQGYKPTGVISRTILTDVESSQLSERVETSVSDIPASLELQEETLPLVDNPPTDSQHRPIIKEKPPRPLGEEAKFRKGQTEVLELPKTISNSWSQPSEDPSDSRTPTPASDHRRPPAEIPQPVDQEGDADWLKPGHADEM